MIRGVLESWRYQFYGAPSDVAEVEVRKLRAPYNDEWKRASIRDAVAGQQLYWYVVIFRCKNSADLWAYALAATRDAADQQAEIMRAMMMKRQGRDRYNGE